MKKFFVAALLFLMLPWAAFAQNAGPQPMVPVPVVAVGGSGSLTNFAAGDMIIGKTANGVASGSTTYGSNGGLSLSGGPVPAFQCFYSDVASPISCTPNNLRARQRLFVGNAVNMADTSANSTINTFFGTTPGASWVARDAQTLSMSDAGMVGLAGITQTATTVTGHGSIGGGFVALNNNPTTAIGAWGIYVEAQHNPGVQATSYALEADCKNATANNYTGNPYGIGYGCFGLWIAGGADNSYGPTATQPASAAIVVTKNATTWNEGLVFLDQSITVDANGNAQAVQLPKGYQIQWWSDSVTKAGAITSQSANTIQIGGLDQASPVAQSLTGMNVLAGTSNTVGGALNLAGGKGTGNVTGGPVVLQVSLPGSTGGTQNNYSTVAVATSGNTTTGGIFQIANTASIGTVDNGATFAKMYIKNNGGGNTASAAFLSYQASAAAPAGLFLGFSRTATLNAHAAVQANDALGTIYFDGSDGTNFRNAAQIVSEAEGTIATAQVPARIRFLTATAAGTLTEAFRIDSSQQIQIASAGLAANGSVATVLGSLGPTGSHTTVQEWIAVKGTGGAVRYIPGF